MTGFIDPAFRTVVPGKSAFHIWRVEKLEVRPIAQENHGTFYDGDSYIVYSAIGSKQSNDPGKLDMHIHFWLGAESSQDEIATAAIKTVELDDYLGGVPTQHREVQGHESARFKSYFKNGFRILKGGIASGLTHVTDDFTCRLFRVKGKRSPILTEMAPVSWSQFNSGDCFLLETKTRVFVWVGSKANNMEKLQAAKNAMQLRDERPGSEIVFVEEDQEANLVIADQRDFEEHLPLSERVIQPPEPDSDVSAENSRTALKLYRCTDESGTCKIVQEKEGPLRQADLTSDDSFIVDNAMRGIWVWVGKRATTEERRQAMSNAQGFVSKKNYPPGTAVTRVIDGAEPTEFKMLFTDWRELRATTGFNRQYSLSKIAPTVNKKFDATALHNTPALAADTQLVDDGSGHVTVWRLHGKELEQVEDDRYGVFFDGDCYLIYYRYNVNHKERHILYYWLGAHSSQDERGTIAWHTVQMDDDLAGEAVQVRVVQGKEPPHFLTIFKGNMIIFNGGYASSFDGVNGQDVGIPTNFLVQVRGGESHNTQAIQVPFRASSLNSNDVFVVSTANVNYVWCGKGSTGDERERAKSIAGTWGVYKETTIVSEGQEKDDFWNVFPNGQESYANDERLRDANVRVPARLFHCSNASGYFKAEEIVDFAQSDLVSDDVMVLDAGSAIFIWIGAGANKEERLSVNKLVFEYLESDPRGRDIDTPIIQVQQGFEPPNFTGFFGAWDMRMWDGETFDSFRQNVEGTRVIEHIQLNNEQKFPVYSLDILREQDPEKLPDDVDVTQKEAYLSDEDFAVAFNLTKEDFYNLPEWKRQNLKKAAKLF